MAWLAPTLYYVLSVGALGVTGKLALRHLHWPDLILWSGLGYVVVASFLLITGHTSIRVTAGSWWAMLSAALAISGLIALYVALGHGDATKVSAISAAYPAVTLLLAAATLSEALTVARVAGVALVVLGVIVLTVAR
ncbi:MAG: EamA family transporter [Solirubrobacterales bacterium]|nr:EamA family transporter [Solirubrobacterales bacterium]